MKKIVTLLSTLACLMALVACGSTSAEKRSLTWNASDLTNEKKAKILAENYDMETRLFLRETAPSDFLLVCSNDKDEHVVFTKEVYKKYEEYYVYVETPSNCTSCYTVKFNNGLVCKLKSDSSSVYVNKTNVWLTNKKELTESMKKNRERLRSSTAITAGFSYKDELKEIKY